MSEPLRVGRISALNMYPLYDHLAGPAGAGLAFTDGLPTALNTALLKGRVDVSAVSSITYARHADRLTLLPVASIAASGAVDSIQLFSRVPFDAVRSVAITPHSASSVALLRILVGPDVSFEPLVGTPHAALDAADGVLLIADEALAALADAAAPFSTDLGDRWQRMTGLPMVFAVWAARADAVRRRPAEIAAVSALISAARERFAADPAPVVARAAERFPFTPAVISAYFARLSYDFGPAERAGLARFLELARDANELDAMPEIPRLAA